MTSPSIPSAVSDPRSALAAPEADTCGAPASTTGALGLPQAHQPSLAELLEVVDALAARRPVAARLVAMTGDDSVGSRELAAALVADVTLTARVLKLANSAYYGLGGRVRTVSFAVTVVGFAAVRAMAAAAAAGLNSDDLLPEDFWPRCKATALASSELAPLFGLSSPDAFCLGLLSGLGQAVLAQHDPSGYQDLLTGAACAQGGTDRSVVLRAEVARYGLRHTEVSAAVLSSWSFPRHLTAALALLDPTGQVEQVGHTSAPATDPAALPHDIPATSSAAVRRWSQCLASAVEAAARLTCPHGAPLDVLQISGGVVTEDRLHAMLPRLGEAVAASDW